jgi:nicotinic acid mononucleotide adenylyltransferase
MYSYIFFITNCFYFLVPCLLKLSSFFQCKSNPGSFNGCFKEKLMARLSRYLVSSLISLSLLSLPNLTSSAFASETVTSSQMLQFNRLYGKVHDDISFELDAMSAFTNAPRAKDLDFRRISSTLDDALATLTQHFHQGKIDPFFEGLVTEDKHAADRSTTRKLRIGYFPVAADPLHWAHLLTALEAMAQLELDKVVFIVAGADPRKPDLTEVGLRHSMAKSSIGMFHDFFAYSDIAMSGNDDGETNVFRELVRNPHLEITAYYLVGSDHFNWEVEKRGKLQDDTVKKLEQNMSRPELGFDQVNGKHKIVAAFIARNKDEITPEKLNLMRHKVSYELKVVVPSLSFSSTEIREYFQGKSTSGMRPLRFLPYQTLQIIQSYNLYAK